MTVAGRERTRVVLYEGGGARPLDGERRYQSMLALLEDGWSVTRAAPEGKVAPADDSPHLVFAEYETEALSSEDPRLEFHDLRGLAPERLPDVVRSRSEARGEKIPEAWKPWFPVIDFDRCTNCLQCMSFCLFDVYGVDQDKNIQVQKQSNCKTDCPACSRVCPDAAILFPKYKKGPINGDVVTAADLNSESMKVDISALLGGDIYSSLRTRRADAKKRFSTERDESKALLERKRCLKKLQQTLDIPDEVLMTLPSAESIEEKAKKAREKAEKRAARSQTVADKKPAPSSDDWDI